MLSNYLRPFLVHWRKMNPNLSTEEIRQALAKAGWTEQEITEGLEFLAQREATVSKDSIPKETPQPVQAVVKPSFKPELEYKPKTRRPYKLIVSLVIIIGITFASYSYIEAKYGENLSFAKILEDVTKLATNLIPDTDSNTTIETEPEQVSEQPSSTPKLLTLEERLAEEEQTKSTEPTQTSVSVPKPTPARTTQTPKQTTTQTTGQNFANVPPATTSTG